MGEFGWRNADKEISRSGCWLLQPDGNHLHEPIYDGYGMFAGQDVYVLVALWNREYLAAHPDFGIPQNREYNKEKREFVQVPPKPVKEFYWYPLYADLSLSVEDVEEEMSKTHRGWKPDGGWAFREIGIDIACYDKQNANLPYPIKVTSKPMDYDSVGASMQYSAFD